MDIRLWKQLTSAKRLLIGISIGGAAVGIFIVLQAALLAHIVNNVYINHASFHQVEPYSLALLGVMALRALVIGMNETWALNQAAQSQARLRERFLSYLLKSGPMATNQDDSGSLINLAVQGIDDLEVFLARYFPQMIVTAIVPVIVWIQVIMHDWISGLILIGTLPLIPLFMILIGRQAENLSKRQIDRLNRLSGHFLDVLHGLDTLKLFGRSRHQTRTIYDQSEAFRASTMKTLRMAFLSGMILELIASLSMAFIAVAIGLRLIHADMTFETAFMVLVLAPEFYIPWRALGAKFHDGLKGAGAAKALFDIMDTPAPVLTAGRYILANHGPWPMQWCDVSFTYPGRSHPALDGINVRLSPGERLAIVGPSGSGKTTFVQLLLGMGIYDGDIRIGDHSLDTLDLAWWRTKLSWVTQRPYFFDGSLLDNMNRVRPEASLDDIRTALIQAGAWDFVRTLQHGWNTPIGQEGFRLSGGQRQRLALARAFLLDTPIVIFDEPTQSLDLSSEEALIEAMERLANGRTTVTIAHRMITAAKADWVLVLEKGRIAQWGSPSELEQKPGIFQSFVQAYEGRTMANESVQARQVL